MDEDMEKRYALALEGARVGLWDWDMRSGTVYFSPVWKAMLGYGDDEIENSFDGWRRLWHPDDADSILKAIDDYREGRKPEYEIAHRLLHKDGRWRWILTRGAMLKDEDGKPYRWVGTNVDISAEKELSLELERFFSVNLDLLCIANINGYFLKTNKAWADILGYSSEELKGRRFLDFIHPDDFEATMEAISSLKAQEQVINFVNRYRSKDGSYRYVEWRSHPYGDLIYAAARDVTERIEYEQRISELSIRDPLTGLYNRRYIFDRLGEILAEHARSARAFAVAIIDIDHFKDINDRYGHVAGDYVLKELASTVSAQLRPYDLFGRYGGEEFIVISTNSDKEQARAAFGRILGAIRDRTFSHRDEAIKVTVSCGIADSLEAYEGGITSERAVEKADERLYAAKRSGRDRIVCA